MGQVTKDTLEHMRKAALAGVPETQYPLTCNEVLQLVHLANLGLESHNYRAEESWYPKYVVYEDVGDDGCGNGTMRQRESSSPYLDVALEYLASNPKCHGIFVEEKDGTQLEQSTEVLEELLKIARSIWNPATLMQILAVRPDLMAKMPERMPLLKHRTQYDANAAYVKKNLVAVNVDMVHEFAETTGLSKAESRELLNPTEVKSHMPDGDVAEWERF